MKDYKIRVFSDYSSITILPALLIGLNALFFYYNYLIIFYTLILCILLLSYLVAKKEVMTIYLYEDKIVLSYLLSKKVITKLNSEILYLKYSDAQMNNYSKLITVYCIGDRLLLKLKPLSSDEISILNFYKKKGIRLDINTNSKRLKAELEI